MLTRILILLCFVIGSMHPAYAEKRIFLTIGSGSTTGVYYPIAMGIAKIINKKGGSIRANARSTGGSTYNILAIEAGQLQLAIVQNDIAYYAARGESIPSLAGNPAKKLRGIATLYPEYVHILANANETIDSISDLRGKRVYVGDIGSGAEQSAKQILEAYGLKLEDIHPIRGSAGLGAQLLQDGRISAMFFTAGLGNAAIQQVLQTAPVKFLVIDNAHAQEIKEKYPFYVLDTIPANTYKDQQQDLPALAVKAMLVASADLPPHITEYIINALFENPTELKKLHANLERYLDVKNLFDAMPIELADGTRETFVKLKLIENNKQEQMHDNA